MREDNPGSQRPPSARPVAFGLGLLLCLALGAHAFAAEARIAPDNRHIDLQPWSTWDLDRAANQDERTMFARVDAGKFHPLPARGPTFGFHGGAWWLHARVRNDSGRDQRWVLVLSYALIDGIDLYLRYPDGRIEHGTGGDKLPFSARALAYRHPNFWLDLPTGSSVDILLRAQSSSSIQLPLHAYSPGAFAEMVHTTQLGFGIYQGILLALLLYNLVLWLGLRNSNHLWYVLHLAGVGLLSACVYGFAFEWFWPESPWFANAAVPVSIALAQLAMQQFARRFLDLKRNWPRGERIARALLWAFALLALASLALPYRLAVQVGTALVFPGVAFIIVAGLHASSHGWRAARLFLVAWATLLLGAASYALVSFGILPKTPLTEYGIQIGSALEMFILSFALAWRYAMLRNENERTIREAQVLLERRVNERTHELQNALEQLADANARLRESARRDPLTGLFNRSHLRDVFERMRRRARQDGQNLALLLIEADGFAAINARLGHPVGDSCLRAIGTRIAEVLSDNNVALARFDAAIFAALLPCTDTTFAEQAARRVCQSFAGVPLTYAETRNTMTVSIGLLVLGPDVDIGIDAAVRQAQAALAAVRAAGGNDVRVSA